jgi:hypothetical protein
MKKSTFLLVVACFFVFPMVILILGAIAGIYLDMKFEDTVLGKLINSDK